MNEKRLRLILFRKVCEVSSEMWELLCNFRIICPNSDAMDSYWSKTNDYVGIINSMADKFICAPLYLGVLRNENSLFYLSLFAENVTPPIILIYGNERGTELSFRSYLISQDYALVTSIYF